MSLARLYFGKDDAEADVSEGGLLQQGFVRTRAYEEAYSGRKSLIIGRKGSGKSAICYMLQCSPLEGWGTVLVTPDEISADELRRFELAGITRERSKMLVWRYVFAVAIAKHIVSSSSTSSSDTVSALRRFLRENGEVVELTFQEKFWRILERLKASLSLEAFGVKVEGEVGGSSAEPPSAGLRIDAQLDTLEKNIMRAWREDRSISNVMLLVDQVDLVWSNDRNSDLMVIGLLLAAKRLQHVFKHHVRPVVFLRTDIYDLLQFPDRDKFRGDEWHINWKPEGLLDLLHQRARASLGDPIDEESFWAQMFPKAINSEPIKEYLVSRTLMRPRDIIQFANACRDIASTRGQVKRIGTEDVLSALALYSNWKLSDLINEWRINYPFLSDSFAVFSNTSFLISRGKFEKRFAAVHGALVARYPGYENALTVQGVLEILYGISFLGVIRDGRACFAYEDPNTIGPGESSFVIHPCFREALRSTSSLELQPYTEWEGILTEEVQRGHSKRGYGFRAVRGTPSVRIFFYLRETVERLQAATHGFPDDLRGEILHSLQRMAADADKIRSESLVAGYSISQRILVYLRALKGRLDESDFAKGIADEFYFLIERAIEELQYGILETEALE